MLLKFSSVAQMCQTLCNPMDCCTPGLPVHHQLPELALTHVHWVRDAIQPSHPLSSPSPLPSIFPSISVFSNESVRHIRWPQYWSFSFSISPSSVAATATAKSLQSCPTLWPHEPQHARPPCPSPSPGVYSNSRPLSRWCLPAISSFTKTYARIYSYRWLYLWICLKVKK